MKGLVLAAGYGTRLLPLTQEQAKALLLVNDVPVIERILDKISSLDQVDDIYIVSNMKFYPKFQDWIKTYLAHSALYVYNDGSKNPGDMLGAVKDMEFVINKAGIDEDLLVVAGDNLFEFPVKSFCEFAFEKQAPCIAVKDIGDISQAKKFGVLKLDNEGRVFEFAEKSENPSSTLISICFYYFPKDTLELIVQYLEEGHNPDAPGRFIEWLSERVPVYGWQFSESWFDIGDMESLRKANKLYAGMESEECTR
ncbi:nucleotidyltransferase family protein [Planctomycetota bacterium]